MKHPASCKGIVMDMDGTFFLGAQLLPGALAFLDFLNAKNLPFFFLTNNTSKGHAQYVEKLSGMGVAVNDLRIFTAGDATIAFIQQKYPHHKVFLLGTESLAEDFRNAGIILVDDDPDLVVIGYDTSLTYARLAKFCGYVRAGLPYLATHPDINCPTPDGPVPDIGAMMALVEQSTGRKADAIFGKPDPNILIQVGLKMGVDLEDLLMVGDRLYTDIALGNTAGVTTVLVLTGETQKEDLVGSPFKPDFICRDLNGLITLLG